MAGKEEQERLGRGGGWIKGEEEKFGLLSNSFRRTQVT